MLLYFLSASLLVSQAFALWPIPTLFSSGSNVLWIAPGVKVTFNGQSVRQFSPFSFFNSITEKALGLQSVMTAAGPAGSIGNGSFTSQTVVQSAISRTLQVMFTQSLVPWKLFPRNQLSLYEPAANSKKNYITCLEIVQTGADCFSTFKPLAGELDESYNLTISADGIAKISAVSPTGVIYGLESFTQLFYQHSSGASSGVYTTMAPISIQDSPKFSHRGLNMDLSRSWYPVSDILRTIDALSMNKFNRLHLHMTDSQSWPLDIPSIPELSQQGAYLKGLSYTPADFKNIQTYAIMRGVEVIVEFDMPGHTSAIGLSHPELLTAYNAHPWNTYCAEPPCGSLKLNSPAVDAFLEKLFDDVLPRVAPYSAYFHTGGDEVKNAAYLLDETVRSDNLSVIQPFLQKFVDRNHAQIRKAGLTPMVWEEMALDWNLTLGSDVLVQSWQSDEAVFNITAKGHKVLAGNYNYWYLDCGKGQWLDFTEAQFSTYYPFQDYCKPVKNWRLMYSYDPLTGVPADRAHLVIGGEVHMWSEQTDPVNFDGMVWPRASAAGEVLWSGRQDANGKNRTQTDASPRLAEMRERMLNRGIKGGPVQMLFCTQGNSTLCTLETESGV